MKISVLGNGGFGTAMALVSLKAGHEVRLWGFERDYTPEIQKTRENPRYLPGVRIPEEVLVTSDGESALTGAEAVLVAVPTQHVRSVITSLAASLASLGEEVPLISLSKGLEQSSRRRPSQVLAEVLPKPHVILVLCGPSHAEEVARGLPTTVVLAGRQEDQAQTERMQEALSSDSFRIYRNTDLLGVELCAALKNVMAVAAGMADGLGLGDNAKAAILSRGIVEMSRYGMAEGAELSTFFGLAGMGDLAVTAFSRHGRNRALGERIGRGESLEEILASTHKVAEGVWTSRVVRERAKELGVEMPICRAVSDVLFEGLPLPQALRQLMARDPKEEILS